MYKLTRAGRQRQSLPSWLLVKTHLCQLYLIINNHTYNVYSGKLIFGITWLGITDSRILRWLGNTIGRPQDAQTSSRALTGRPDLTGARAGSLSLQSGTYSFKCKKMKVEKKVNNKFLKNN